MKNRRVIRMSLLVLAALTVGLAAAVVRGPGGLMAQKPERQWVQSGLPGLAVYTLTLDPTDSQVLYATTPLAIHKTTDGGQSWSVLTTEVPNVVAIAVDPQHSATLYTYSWPKFSDFTVDFKGWRKSTDGGQTWFDPYEGPPEQAAEGVNCLAIDPSNPQVLYAGTAYQDGRYGQILKSVDGAATWQPVYDIQSVMGVGDVTALAIPGLRPELVYATHSVYHGGVVLKTTDGGINWTPLGDHEILSAPTALALDSQEGLRAFVAWQQPMGAGVRLHCTNDGGSTWSQCQAGLPPSGSWSASLAMDQSNPRRAFVGLQGEGAGVYATEDGGGRWTPLDQGAGSALGKVLCLAYAASSGILYAGTEDGVWIFTTTRPPEVITEVTNGDFEGGFFGPVGQSVANGWAAYVAGGEPTFDGEHTTVHSGSWAQKISGHAPFAAGVAQIVTVKPGASYRVTVHYQLYPPGDGQAFLGVQDGTAPAQWVGGGEGGVWQLLSQTLTATSGQFILYLHGNNGTGLNTNVYFDDVTVTELGQP
jgi:photosystem II stability/assembly factor-like uncharacterized protein